MAITLTVILGFPELESKRAEKIFSEKGYTWQAVVETFEEKGMTEADALTNARLARILTINDYDEAKKNQSYGPPLQLPS